MCATVKIMFGGSFIDIIIRPGGNHIQQSGANLLDVRDYFKSDDTCPFGDPDIQKLRAAALYIRDMIIQSGGRTFTVQCRQGRSRSPRCVGAFLMLYNNYSRSQALEELRRAYSPINQSAGCNQAMNENAVDNWLRQLG